MSVNLSSANLSNRRSNSASIVTSWATRHGVSAPFGGHGTLANDLAAYFPLTSDASDSTENKASGAEQGTINYVSGINNNCADFTANPNYYKWASDLSFTGGDDDEITFSGWFYQSSGIDNSGHEYVLSDTSYAVALDFDDRDPTINTGGGYDSWGSPLSEDTWHHVVICFPGNNDTVGGYIVVDNAWGSRTTFDWHRKPDTRTLGYYHVEVGTNDFKGYMAELGFWNRKLTQSEVSDLYNSGSGLFYDS